MTKKHLIQLSIFNIALLATHQVDASYQREWELFRVPGELNFFLFFNLVAISVLLIAFSKLSAGQARNWFWKYVVPATGLVTVLLHAVFIVIGNPEFTQPISISILMLILVTSIWQSFLELRDYENRSY